MKVELLKKENPKVQIFPDIALETKAEFTGTLEKVGMEEVELAVKLKSSSGEPCIAAAFANLFVSLDAENKKGIHMSRLLLEAHKILDNEYLNYESLKNLIKGMKSSHQDISLNAYADISFNYLLKRPALISNNEAWRIYPLKLSVKINENDEISFTTNIRITYSSTCPCSAALSRQLIQEEFLKVFTDSTPSLDDIHEWLGRKESQVATPHSQRSYADIQLEHTSTEFNLDELIDALENCIATPVQGAVKREDEQEFARLNGSNFMFSEDAARKLKIFCENLANLDDFSIKVQHLESLHAHNAVAYARKSSK